VHKKAGRSPNARRRIIWQLAGVNDLVRSRQVSPGELSINRLSGRGRGGGRGTLDLLLLKLDILDECVANQIVKRGISSDAKPLVRSTVESHPSYQSFFGHEVDITWMLTLPQSAKEFAGFVGDRLLTKPVRMGAHAFARLSMHVCPNIALTF